MIIKSVVSHYNSKECFMKNIKTIFTFISFLLAFSYSHLLYAANDELIFATAPTHSASDTKKIYTPIVEYLAKKTGKKIKLSIPKSFTQYSIQMQRGDYDIIFDGPHLSDWRINHQQHRPIVRLPGRIQVVLAVKNNSKLTKLSDLQYGIKACAFFPPNLLTMTFLSHYSNPARQPAIIRVQGFKNIIKCVKKGKGDVAVLRKKLWGKAKKTGANKGLRIMATFPETFPERTFTVGPKINPDLAATITKLLLNDEGKKASAALLKRFKKKNLIKANHLEYNGLSALVSTVWGFN